MAREDGLQMEQADRTEQTHYAALTGAGFVEPEDSVDGDVDTEPLSETASPVEDGSEIPSTSRKVHRRSRRTRARSKTIAMKRLTKEEIRNGLLLPPDLDAERPHTRGDCCQDARPCPWVSCKYHLYLDVNPETGSIKLNFPDLDVWQMKDTCALDVAERSGITLEEVGEIMNLTRERVRQVEVRGLLKLKTARPDGCCD